MPATRIEHLGAAGDRAAANGGFGMAKIPSSEKRDATNDVQVGLLHGAAYGILDQLRGRCLAGYEGGATVIDVGWRGMGASGVERFSRSSLPLNSAEIDDQTAVAVDSDVGLLAVAAGSAVPPCRISQ